ncbi:MAG: LptA/OstA family protein, partial [Myxococcota bacterium]
MSQRHTSRGTAFVLAFLLLGPPSAAAQNLDLRRDQAAEITADRIVYESKRRVYVAQGSVRIVQGERRIDADWLVFNRTTQRGIAAGRVRVDDGKVLLDSRFLEFDVRGEQGFVLGGRLDLGEDDFLMAAGELVQTGKDTYEARGASFTSCRCPDDEDRLPWQINTSRADVELGGYAMVTNNSVDILGIPTLWLPWLMFPVKTDRATGLLLPEIGFGGSNGYEVALPLFWAARHNINLIATPRYLSKRGVKPELTLETVYGEHSQTTLFGSYIRD